MVLHPQQAVDDGGLPDHDPFRSPRRAGGEDDIRGMLRLRERQRRGIRRRQRLLIAQAFEAGDIAKARPLIFRGNQQRRPCVFQHHPQTIVGIAGIQRQPRGAGFNDAVQRQGQEYRTRQRHRHAIARLDAPRAKLFSQRHHLLAHLAVAKLPAAVRQRRGIRGFRRLFRHPRAQGGERQIDGGGVHPL